MKVRTWKRNLEVIFLSIMSIGLASTHNTVARQVGLGSPEMERPAADGEDEHLARHGEIDGGAELVAGHSVAPQKRRQQGKQHRGGQRGDDGDARHKRRETSGNNLKLRVSQDSPEGLRYLSSKGILSSSG